MSKVTCQIILIIFTRVLFNYLTAISRAPEQNVTQCSWYD